MKDEKVILIGPPGSNKNFIAKNLSKKGLKSSKIITTSNKINNKLFIEYDKISKNEFLELINKDKLIFFEKKSIKGENFYEGITKNNFKKAQIFILTPSQYKKIKKSKRKKCFVILMDIDKSIRENRLHKKINDFKIFKSIKDYDLKVTCSDFNHIDIYGLMD